MVKLIKKNHCINSSDRITFKKKFKRENKSEDIFSLFNMSSAEDMSCFTVTWEIENFSLFLEFDKPELRSPAWKTDTNKECAWWRLSAYKSDSYILFNLFKLIGSTVLDLFQMSLIAPCGEIELQRTSDLKFRMDRSSIFCTNGESKFPDDILTLSCKMWKKTMKAGEYRHHSIVQKVNYSWKSKQSNPEKLNYTFFEKNNFLLYIMVWVKPQKNTHTIVIGSVPRRESYVSIVGCNLIINDGLGHVVNKEHIYPFISWRCEIENFGEKSDGSGLQFQLDCLVQVQKNHIPEFISSESSLNDPSGILNTDLLQIYKEETFSDTTLTTEGKSFSAHRSILAARSPVFSAMLKKKDMSEGHEGVIVIDDIDSVTLDRMLVFLYSDSLEEMNWEEATSLYYAADKYAIQYLKQKCADVLKTGLSMDNACQALILADTHSDQELMKCTIDFIRVHQKVIFSAEWENLEENHSKLAAKSLREVFKKLRNYVTN